MSNILRTAEQVAATTARRVATTAANRAAGVLPVHEARRVARAAKLAAPRPVFVALAPGVRRQAVRILEALRAFTFEPGGAWQAQGLDGRIEEGWSPRVAGAPIYDTIGQASGVLASRAQVEEAVASVVDRRQAALPPRMAALVPAIEAIAVALAAGRSFVETETGRERIAGLPPLDLDAAA